MEETQKTADELIKEFFKTQYDDFLKFVRVEREKGEGICKKVQSLLYNKKNVMKKKDIPGTFKYSSGRKVSVFDDEVMFFLEAIILENGITLHMVLFCKEEIESYARSYRLYTSNIISPDTFSPKDLMVKVFEFKPEKI